MVHFTGYLTLLNSICNIIYNVEVSGLDIGYYANEIGPGFNDKIIFSDILERHTGCVKDVPQCATICSSNPLCMSFFYKADGVPICQLHSVFFTDPSKAKDVTGWLYYLLDHDQCLYQEGFHLDRISGSCFKLMTNAIHYTQMIENCRQLNATIMKLSSVKKEKRMVKIIGYLWPTVKSYVIQGSYNDSWVFDDRTNMTYFNWVNGASSVTGAARSHIILTLISNHGSVWITGYDDAHKGIVTFDKTLHYICERFKD